MTAPLPLHERQLTELIAAVDTRTGLVASLDAIRRRWAFGSRKARASIDDIARRTGVPRSTIHVYVTGRTLPPPDLLDTMVAALGASRDERRAWAAALERVENAERDHPNPERPNQLPRVVPLVGRDEELAQLDALAARAGSAGFLGALVGPGGSGKTALAVAWAARRSDLFPDGLLYADLRGYSSQPPVDPVRVLGRFLSALGQAAPLPREDADDLIARLRSVLANRRVLVLLDNAQSDDQVRPLLPGPGPSSVLVTSRSKLSSLVVGEGAHRLDVCPLTDDAAREILGVDNPDTELALERCGGNPLALRIVRERLEALGSVSSLTSALERPEGALDALTLPSSSPGTDLRTILSWSYERLDDGGRRLLRRLAVVPGPRLRLATLAAVLDEPEPALRPALAALSEANLLANEDAEHWARHDLVTAFAWERLDADESPDERQALEERLVCYYVALCRATGADQGRSQLPVPTSRPSVAVTAAEAAAALSDEDDLLSGVLQRSLDTAPALAWVLAEQLAFFDAHDARGPARVPWYRRALESAETAGDRRATLAMRARLAACAFLANDYDEAQEHLRNTIRLAEALDETPETAYSMTTLALTHIYVGQLDEAERWLTQALELAGDDRELRSRVLVNLGNLEISRGAQDEALRLYREAAEPDAHGRRTTTGILALLNLIGEALHHDDLPEAGRLLDTVLADPLAQDAKQLAGPVLTTTADVRLRQGDHAAAREALELALDWSRDRGDVYETLQAQSVLGRLLRAEELPHAALAALEIGADMALEHQHQYIAAQMLRERALVLRDLGDPDAARVELTRALELAHELALAEQLRADLAELD